MRLLSVHIHGSNHSISQWVADAEVGQVNCICRYAHFLMGNVIALVQVSSALVKGAFA